MRKIQLVFMGILCLIIMASCSKENTVIQKHFNDEIVTRTKSLFEVTMISTKSNEQLASITDKEEIKLSSKLYHLGLAIRELTKDENFNVKVIEMSQESDFQLTELEEFVSINSYYKSLINEEIVAQIANSERLGIPTSNNTNLEDISSDLTYNYQGDIQKYVPCIYVLNSNNLRPD